VIVSYNLSGKQDNSRILFAQVNYLFDSIIILAYTQKLSMWVGKHELDLR